MSCVKTAISIEEPIFKDVNILAKDMNVSRSYIFSQAVKEYIQKHKNRALLEQINAAYNDSQEDSLAEEMRIKHSNVVSDKW